MYESVFGFTSRPFVEVPRTDLYFPASAIEQARETLVRCVDRAEGLGLLIGPAGTGKTLLCHLLAQRFGEAFRIVMLASARLCTRRALLQNILFELGLPYRDMEEGELRLTLIDHLQPSPQCPHGMLLLIDEAHCLPLRLLDEVRMITNLVRDGQPRVRLVLAGSPLLEERFASPRLESFNQRITARCYLHNFNRDETFQYVQRQIETCGCSEQLFTDDALAAVHTASDGVARLINQLCDHALMMASVGGRRQLDAAGIEEAWSDLQQLPAPWQSSAETPDEEQTGVVEFGQLSDEGLEETIEESLDNSTDFSENPSAAGLAIEGQFDEIQHHVAQASADDSLADASQSSEDHLAAEAQFEPLASGSPEVELVFHGGHDPFGHAFEEEEVVVDRYATLDANELAKRPRVSSAEGRNLAEALKKSMHDAAESELSLIHENRQTLDPASDPVMPENEGLEDRDLIVVVDDLLETTETSSTSSSQSASQRPPGRARRQEYRQLFSNMRQG